ncbi:hypothetical protein HY522_02810 [bacterium]|nr:hypothetical protein [bacterium]
MMRFRKNRAESAVAAVPPAVGTGSAATVTEATTVTVTIERDKPQSKVQVVIRDDRADLRQHRELPDVHQTDREFFQKFHRGKPELKYEFWVRRRFPFWKPA